MHLPYLNAFLNMFVLRMNDLHMFSFLMFSCLMDHYEIWYTVGTGSLVNVLLLIKLLKPHVWLGDIDCISVIIVAGWLEIQFP